MLWVRRLFYFFHNYDAAKVSHPEQTAGSLSVLLVSSLFICIFSSWRFLVICLFLEFVLNAQLPVDFYFHLHSLSLSLYFQPGEVSFFSLPNFSAIVLPVFYLSPSEHFLVYVKEAGR